MAVPARAGRYAIELALGQAGSFRTFLARDPELGRQVVVLAIADDGGRADETRAKLADDLRRAGRAAASLSHPAIGVVHDAGEDAELGPYVVSELVRGLTLRERMARGRLLRGETASLARALGSALAYAHAEGVVHGHIKPEIVWLSPAGPKIVDFGTPASEDSAYAAPELATGATPNARTDQYALAACLYEAFLGKPARVHAAHASALTPNPPSAGRLRPPPVMLPELGGEAHVEAIFDVALSPDPRRRFPTCELFGDSLAQALEVPHGTPPSMPISQSSIVPRATRRWQNAIAGIAVLVIFLLIGLGGQHHGSADGVSLARVARAFAATFHDTRSGGAPARPSAGSEAPRAP
jgi:serine/threonine protein kinase